MENLSVLIYENARGQVPAQYSQMNVKERDNVIREAFLETMGLTEGYSKKEFRQAWRENKNKVYAITEEIASQIMKNGELERISFFEQFVDVRNEALGDSVEFIVESENELEFAEFSGNHFDLRRTRVESHGFFTPTMRDYGVKVYSYFEQVASGRISFTDLCNKIEIAMRKKLAELAETTFTSALNNLPVQFKVSGSYDENSILEMLSHVEASTGQKPHLVGTVAALRKLAGVSDYLPLSTNMRDELNDNGVLSVWNSYKLIPLAQGHKIGGFEFTMDNNKIYALTGGEKPVAMLLEGDVEVKEVGDGVTNADRSLEQAIVFKAGCAVKYNKALGVITLA